MLKFEIPLNPVTKKNSMRKGRNGVLLQSKAYVQYERDAVRLIPGAAKVGIAQRINIKALYYTKTDYNAPTCKAEIDITNLHNALHDVLQASGVIAGDHCRIVASTDGSRVLHDRKNPRTEVTITEVVE